MKPLRYLSLALMILAVLILTSCLSPIIKVEKRCTTGRFGSTRCECRDLETGRFAKCPAEWRARVSVELP